MLLLLQRQVGPTVIGSFGNVVLERRVDDVKYTLRATETTIQNLKGLNGAVLTVEKPFGKAFPMSQPSPLPNDRSLVQMANLRVLCDHAGLFLACQTLHPYCWSYTVCFGCLPSK